MACSAKWKLTEFLDPNDIDELLGAACAASSGSSLVLPALISGIGFAGIAATDSNDDADADTDAPAPPTASLNGIGTISSGTAEANATVKIRTADGTLIGSGTADADGNYAIDLDMPQDNGETLLVTQIDEAGNVSDPTDILAPDLTAPEAPTATIALDGTAISGTSEVGATITVRDPDGTIIGTTRVDEDGNYVFPLTPARVDGEVLGITQSDSAGNVSTSVTVTADDSTPPPAPTATIDDTGRIVTGTGVTGSTVEVRTEGGTASSTDDHHFLPQVNFKSICA